MNSQAQEEGEEVKKSTVFYSNTGKEWREFGELTSTHIDLLLRFLEDHHTANFYQIDGVIYQRTEKGYKVKK